MSKMTIAILILILCFIFSIFGWRTFRGYLVEPKNENRASEENLKMHVKKLSHEIGDRSIFKYEKLKEAGNYIKDEFKKYGYELELHTYNLYNMSSENIIAEKKGRLKPNEVIIIGAHYDTCFNPGADDNASSVAGLLELARLFSDKEVGCTIRFIAFVNEEPPFFKTENMGSFQYVQELKKKNEDIRGVLIMEMIGSYSNRLFSQRYPPFFGFFYPNRANFVAIVSDFHSTRFAREVKKCFRKHSKFPIESVVTFSFVPGVDFSDHWSFWKEGYKAIMITDTAFYRYPYYHSSQDTFEKLDYKSMAEVVYGLYKAIASMAG